MLFRSRIPCDRRLCPNPACGDSLGRSSAFTAGAIFFVLFGFLAEIELSAAIAALELFTLLFHGTDLFGDV